MGCFAYFRPCYCGELWACLGLESCSNGVVGIILHKIPEHWGALVNGRVVLQNPATLYFVIPPIRFLGSTLCDRSRSSLGRIL